MFLQASVILSTGGFCLSACWDTTTPGPDPPDQTPCSRHPPRRNQTTPGTQTPPRSRPLWAQTPQSRPPGTRPSGSRHPPGPDPPDQTPPGSRHPPGPDTLGADTPRKSRLRDTVEERPVRILLQCILVFRPIWFLINTTITKMSTTFTSM